MATQTVAIAEICAAAKQASQTLAATSADVKNAALERMAAGVKAHEDEICEANERDLAQARAAGAEPAILDRLKLTPQRVDEMTRGVRAIASLPDPVGETIEGFRLGNGLQVRKVRVPLGVIAVVYEARPNVTIDCAALCLKAGNAIVLRGSSQAANSNAYLAQIAADACSAEGLPEAAVSIVGTASRDDLKELATQSDSLDLIVPRGGEELKESLERHATVPVLYAAAGNCHVLVDQSADREAALAITLNAKLQRPGVCNACETLLVHSAVAESFLPLVCERLVDAGVELRCDPRAHEIAVSAGIDSVLADDSDWSTEYLSLKLAVGVVDSVEEAIAHVNRYGTGHSEAIVTESVTSADAFCRQVDAACVYVNASTRFTDGGEFGMGAEIGNSTQKLHARGPIGVRELCTFKYLVAGSGQVR